MTEPAPPARRPPGFVVLRDLGNGHWRVVGDADRRPGVAAGHARVQAVLDVTHGEPGAGEVYAVVLRSEWRAAQKL